MRPVKEIDMRKVLELQQRGTSMEKISEIFDCSIATIKRRLRDRIEKNKGERKLSK